MQTPRRNPPMPQGMPLFKPPYSRMTAIDMNTGDHKWMVPTGGGDGSRNLAAAQAAQPAAARRRRHDERSAADQNAADLRLTTGGTNGGPRLVAYDKATGQELASADLPGMAIGTPMTYLADGRRYIALTAQGRTPRDIPELHRTEPALVIWSPEPALALAKTGGPGCGKRKRCCRVTPAWNDSSVPTPRRSTPFSASSPDFCLPARPAEALRRIRKSRARQLFSQMGLAGIIEVFGGAAIALGLLTSPVAFLTSGEMAVAYFQAHLPRGFWPVANGGELAVIFCFVFSLSRRNRRRQVESRRAAQGKTLGSELWALGSRLWALL